MSKQPGDTLAHYAPVSHCDSTDEHLIRLITDGTTTAYAYGASDAGPVGRREDGTYEAICRQETSSGEPCEGSVTWAPDYPAWVTDDYTARALTQHGQPLERIGTPTVQEDPDAVDTLHLTEAARWLLIIENDDELGESQKLAARQLWKVLTGISEDADAVAYARFLNESRHPVTAHVAPF